MNMPKYFCVFYWPGVFTITLFNNYSPKAKRLSVNIHFVSVTTGSHFVRRGDYQLIIRDSEPMRARNFV